MPSGMLCQETSNWDVRASRRVSWDTKAHLVSCPWDQMAQQLFMETSGYAYALKLSVHLGTRNSVSSAHRKLSKGEPQSASGSRVFLEQIPHRAQQICFFSSERKCYLWCFAIFRGFTPKLEFSHNHPGKNTFKPEKNRSPVVHCPLGCSLVSSSLASAPPPRAETRDWVMLGGYLIFFEIGICFGKHS